MDKFELITACHENDLIKLQSLNHINLNELIFPEHGYGPTTPLMLAIRNGSMDIIKYLVEIYNVDTEVRIPNIYSPHNEMTAILACTDIHVIKYLHENGANIYARDSYGNSLLYYILMCTVNHRSQHECIYWLLDNGVGNNGAGNNTSFIDNYIYDYPFHRDFQLIHDFTNKANEIYVYTHKRPRRGVLTNYKSFVGLRAIAPLLPLPIELIVKIITHLFD